MRHVRALLVTLIALGALAGAPASERGELLFVSLYHAGEITAESGERWLALVGSGVDGRLVETRIRVESVEDPILDEGGQTTAREVGIPGRVGPAPIALVRGIPSLEPGPVRMASSGSGPLERGSVVTVTLDGARLDLVASAVGEQGYELAVRDGVRLQVVVLHESLDEKTPELLWAGDLDRDGRPDLLLELSRHYNVSDRALLLSGGAADGELFRVVATLRTVGC